MFRSTAAAVADLPQTEPAPDGVPSDLIPISRLELDLDDAPANGWAAYLADHGISIAFDDIGRRAIDRADAKKLLDAQRQDEIRRRDHAARLEQEAIERDQAWRATLPHGAAWYDLPAGVLPASAMLQQARDAEPRRTPSRMDWLFGDPDTMVYHPLPQADASGPPYVRRNVSRPRSRLMA
jgi:hypothetical protein